MCCFMYTYCTGAKRFTLGSPNGILQTTITIGDKLIYDIYCNGRQILAPSPISMTLDNGEVLGGEAKLTGTSRKKWIRWFLLLSIVPVN